MCKLAIDYSDGIIEAGPDINPDLLQYAKDSNKPILPNPGEDFGEAYEAFYDQLIAAE